jgi:cytochrome c553
MRILVLLCTLVGALMLATLDTRSSFAAAVDKAASVAAFDTVAKVLTHPRCLNCHTSTAWPTQGDDRHRHMFNVVRGTDDRGAPAMRCASCHKDKNVANIPGAKDWHIAPLSQAWTGLTHGALCRALLDPAQNGGLTREKLVAHLRTAPLVLWAWTPGGTRTAPPLPHTDLVKAAETWIKKGANCPAG